MNNSATAIKELVCRMRLIVNFNDAGTWDCYGENGGRGAPLRIFVTPGAMFLEGGEVTSFVGVCSRRELVRDICHPAISECAAFRLWQFWHRATLRRVSGNNSRIGNEILIFGLMLSIAAGIGSIVVVY